MRVLFAMGSSSGEFRLLRTAIANYSTGDSYLLGHA